MNFSKLLFRIASAMGLLGAMSLPHSSAMAQQVNLAQGISIVWAPAYIANKQKLWQRHGIDANVILFPSGRAAQEAVIGGSALWSTTAETPVVFAAMNNLPVRIIGQMNAYECYEIATLRAISKIEDLKQKKIGYAQGTNVHFYYSRLLDRIGATPGSVTAISLSPSDMVTSLANGNLHAFIWTEPHLSQIVAIDPKKFHRIRVPGLYKCHHNIVAMQSTIDTQRKQLVQSLRAMIDAVKFIHGNPNEAIAITAEATKMDRPTAAAAWKDIPFEISLNTDELIRDLELQAKWAKSTGLTKPDSQIPDFRKVVVKDILDAAQKP